MDILRIYIYMCFMSCSFWGYSQSAFYQLATSNADSENYPEAIRLMKMSYEIDKLGADCEEICLDELTRITNYYTQLNDIDSVIHYSNKSWEIVSKILETNPEIACCYGQNIVMSLYNSNCDALALQYGSSLMPVIENIQDSDFIIPKAEWQQFLSGIYDSFRSVAESEFTYLDNALREYLNKDDLRNAQKIVEQFNEWTQKPGRTYKELVSAWLALGAYYMRIGDHFLTKTHVEQAWSLIQEENREPTFEEIMYRINIEKEIPIDPDWLIATTDSLLHSESFAHRWSKRFPDQVLSDRAYLLEARGWGFDHKGETVKAKESILESLEYNRTPNRLNKLGTLSLSLHDYKTATNCFKEIIDSLGFEEVRDDVLSNLCSSFWLDNDKQSLGRVLPQYMMRRKNKVIDCFGFLTAEEREVFISSNPLGGWFETALATGFSSDDQQWAIGNELAYNLALWRKGILLEANRDSQRILNNLPKETQINIQEYFRLRHQYINNIIATDSVSRYWSIERELMKYIGQDSTYLASLQCSWKDIQKKLSSDAVAIEFVETIIPDKHDILNSTRGLGALLASPQYNYPIYIYLGSNDDLSSFTPFDEEGDSAFDLLYESNNAQEAYRSIWLPIEAYLNNVTTVYFSPDGVIHNINLDYIQDLEGNNLCDRYNLIRVSSTRQILNKPKEIINDKTDVLFGDIAYTPGQSIGLNRKRALSRNGFDFLDGTLTEVTEIDSILKGAQYISLKRLRDDATEENFRNLSGRSPEIIHVATHGFYYPIEKAAIENTYIGALSQFSGMYRSGLAFKDAQIKWNKSGDDINSLISPTDGILLSQELSSLDLSNTKLAVLSACQTANGANDYDGVIGLQRGFKLAGVESLLMSLWPVDDDATKMLMINFYQSYTKGNSLQDALHAAQNYVRQTPGFKAPEFWAGWILLDALN